MRAAVLSVGSEILRGDILDTNAPFLARDLSELGFEVVAIRAAGDDLTLLTEAVRQSLQSADLLLLTGGLGPTEDDLTRDAVAQAFGEEMTVDPRLVEEIERRFENLGRRYVPASNRRQAQLIPSASSLPNPNGTAPGWLVRKGGKIAAAMPGPPSEMEPMWRDEVRPQVQRLLPGSVAMRSLMTFGIGESALEERIADVIHRRPDVIIATYAKESGVQVHLTARSASTEDAERLAGETEALLRDRLGTAIFGTGDSTLASAIGDLCLRHGITLGVMESASGGMLGALITGHPGSSTYFRGSIVAYDPEVKARYGVDAATIAEHGAVSPETALAMASAAREALDSSAGIGLTGVAGKEAIDGRAPGTCFIAVCTDRSIRSAEIHRPGARATAQRFFAQSALNLLRLSLVQAEVHA
jgi:nicotinamide-nucleotide amidase